jgi:hypothetical protein
MGFENPANGTFTGICSKKEFPVLGIGTLSEAVPRWVQHETVSTKRNRNRNKLPLWLIGKIKCQTAPKPKL